MVASDPAPLEAVSEFLGLIIGPSLSHLFIGVTEIMIFVAVGYWPGFLKGADFLVTTRIDRKDFIVST